MKGNNRNESDIMEKIKKQSNPKGLLKPKHFNVDLPS